MANRGDSYWAGAIRADPTPHRSCDGPHGSLSMRPLGLAGQRPLQARLARLCRRSHRSPSDRRKTGVSPHHTMICTDVGGRVADGAGSSVAAEWSNRARTVALQPPPGWCGCVCKPGWLWPLRMAKRASKKATRGGERRKAEHGGSGTSHSRTAPGKIRAISAVKAGLVSWHLRARRFVGSVTRRRGGPPAHQPSGRGPGCGFASDRAIALLSQAGVAFGLRLGSPVWFWPRP